MKKMILLALVVCALLALMAGTAFAEGWDTGSYAGTAELGHTWTDITGNNTAYFDASGNPHGGFDVGTHNCTVCHSVHHAEPAGEALLPATVADACIYCHITDDAGYIAIYDGNAANYTDASDYGHNAEHMTSGCTDCHQVHAASAEMVSDPAYGTTGPAMDYLVDKLLKVSGTGTDMLDSRGNVLALGALTNEDVAVSMWCTTCHFDPLGTSGYFNDAYGSWTHVMGPVTNNYTSSSGLKGTIASAPSDSCHSCHNVGDTRQTPALPGIPVASERNFPHWSGPSDLGDPGAVRFLTAATALDAVTHQPTASGDAVDSHADGVCLNCHRGVVSMVGVLVWAGSTFSI